MQKKKKNCTSILLLSPISNVPIGQQKMRVKARITFPPKRKKFHETQNPNLTGVGKCLPSLDGTGIVNIW